MDERAIYALAVADGKTNQDYVRFLIFSCFMPHQLMKIACNFVLVYLEKTGGIFETV